MPPLKGDSFNGTVTDFGSDTRRSEFKRRKAIVTKRVKISLRMIVDVDTDKELADVQAKLSQHLIDGKRLEEFRVYG